MSHRFFLYFLFYFLPFLLQAQSTGLALSLKEKAETFHSDQLDSAIIYMLQAIELFRAAGDTVNYLDCQQYLGSYYASLGDYEKSDSITSLNWDKVRKHLSPKISEQADIYAYSAINEAYRLLYFEEFLPSLNLYELAFEVLEQQDSVNKNELARFYLEAGIACRNVGDNEQAIRYYTKSEVLFQKTKTEDTETFSDIYFNKARAYTDMLLIDSALMNYQKCEKVWSDLPTNSPDRQFNLLMTYRGKALVFEKSEKLDSMLHYAKAAFNHLEIELSPEEDYKISPFTHAVLGSALEKNGKWEQAKLWLLTAKKLNNRDPSTYLRDKEHYIFLALGNTYSSIGKADSALYYYYQAFQLDCIKPVDSPLEEEDILYTYTALKVIPKIVSTIRLSQDSASYEKAIELVNLASQLAKISRASFQAEGSKFDLSRTLRPLYEDGLNLLAGKKELTNSDIGQIINFIEASKSLLLFESLQAEEAKLGLPTELKETESAFKRDIAYYEEKLFEFRQHSKKNEQKVNEYEEALFLVRQNYKRFTDTLEQAYPSYYQQKYEFELAQIEQIQQELTEEEAFIQYFVGDSSIYILGIHPQHTAFHALPFSNSLLKNIQAYLEHLSTFTAHPSMEEGQAYIEAANYLYQELLAPILSEMPDELSSLILSPDGILNYLPFEAFLRSASTENWRYNDLPYLVTRYSTSYTHSATHWLEQRSPVRRKSQQVWLGFAPSYEETQITETVKPFALNRFLTREGSLQLPHAQAEIQQISTLVSGEALLQTDARESDFHRLASSYQVVHLATHGWVEDQRPMYSKLVFAPEPDSGHDGYLHAFEIYNMKLPSDMVVLSACNTGVGKLEKGEGIMSLSRAFFYAGVKSLLMSLWKVSDESTSELMVNFYAGLKQDLPKDKALQQAKLNYLQNQEIAIQAHPYFWAGFVLKGNSEALIFPHPLKKWAYLGLFILGLMIFLAFYRYRKR